jgi:hypothetical protein
MFSAYNYPIYASGRESWTHDWKSVQKLVEIGNVRNICLSSISSDKGRSAILLLFSIIHISMHGTGPWPRNDVQVPAGQRRSVKHLDKLASDEAPGVLGGGHNSGDGELGMAAWFGLVAVRTQGLFWMENNYQGVISKRCNVWWEDLFVNYATLLDEDHLVFLISNQL